MTSKQIEAWFSESLLFKPVRLIAPHLRTNYWLNGRTLTVKRPFRKSFSLRIHELDEIGIETTDQGPFAEDVFWVLKRGEMKIRISQPHPIFNALMDRVGSLEGFDWQPFIEAMGSTENRYFRCWRRPN